MGNKGILYSFFNLRAGWGGWLTPRPGRLTPRNVPVPIVYEAGGAPGPVWTGAENLAPNGIRFPDPPARSDPLYRLSYPAHTECVCHIVFPFRQMSR